MAWERLGSADGGRRVLGIGVRLAGPVGRPDDPDPVRGRGRRLGLHRRGRRRRRAGDAPGRLTTACRGGPHPGAAAPGGRGRHQPSSAATTSAIDGATASGAVAAPGPTRPRPRARRRRACRSGRTPSAARRDGRRRCPSCTSSPTIASSERRSAGLAAGRRLGGEARDRLPRRTPRDGLPTIRARRPVAHSRPDEERAGVERRARRREPPRVAVHADAARRRPGTRRNARSRFALVSSSGESPRITAATAAGVGVRLLARHHVESRRAPSARPAEQITNTARSP